MLFMRMTGHSRTWNLTAMVLMLPNTNIQLASRYNLSCILLSFAVTSEALREESCYKDSGIRTSDIDTINHIVAGRSTGRKQERRRCTNGLLAVPVAADAEHTSKRPTVRSGRPSWYFDCRTSIWLLHLDISPCGPAPVRIIYSTSLQTNSSQVCAP